VVLYLDNFVTSSAKPSNSARIFIQGSGDGTLGIAICLSFSVGDCLFSKHPWVTRLLS